MFAGSTLNLWNSTVFGNGTAEQDGSGTRNEVGGGLLLKPGAIVNAVNATIASNMATTAGGGVFLEDATASFNATNTLIGDNMAATAADVSGAVDGNGYNLVADATGATVNGPANVTGVAAGLSMDGLQMNGGPTMTVALTSGPAVDGGLNSTCACLLYTSPSPRDLSTSRMPSSA